MTLKSNEDLHKLWYVLLKERNALKSDYIMSEKFEGKKPPQNRLLKVKKSMARLLTVLSERKRVREDYKKMLQDDYVEKKRQEDIEKIQGMMIYYLELERNKVEVPPITHELLRAKYKDLRRGKDNLAYIQDMIDYEKQKKDHRDSLFEKYRYSTKDLIDQDAEVD